MNPPISTEPKKNSGIEHSDIQLVPPLLRNTGNNATERTITK